MTRVVVEAAFGTTLEDAVFTGGTWTDITQRVDIETAGISINRGAQDELSQGQAGTCSMRLDNSDGAITPEYTGSPYYPHVVDGTPLRVNVATVSTNFVRNPSFEGGALDTWEWATGVELTAPASPVKTGTNAARVAWNASASDYFETKVYGLTIGATYTASAYVRVPAGDVAVKLRAGGLDSAASAVNDTYTRLTRTFTATGAVATVQILPNAAPAGGDIVVVDAVMVEETASASALNHVSNPTFEAGTSGWVLGSDASTAFAQSSVRAWQGLNSMLITWGGALNSNPSFETTLSPWTAAGGASAARVNTQAQSGSWSAQITPDGVTSLPRMQSEAIPVTAGLAYRAHGWLRCTATRSVGLNINWYDVGGSLLSTSSNAASVTANTWTLFNASFTAPVGAVNARIVPLISGTPPASDLLYVDEARLLVTAGGPSPSVGTTIPALTIGQAYTASAYVYVPAAGLPVQLAVSGISAGTASTLTGQWERISYTFTATATSHTVQLLPVGFPSYGRQVWVDAVQVQEGSSATAWNSLEGAQLAERFWGIVNQWPVKWSGLYSTVSITATDIFSVLSRAEEQMRPMLTQEYLLWGPNALYPMDEESGATSAGDASGLTGPQSLAAQQAGAGGTLEFGAGTAPLGLAGAPLLTPASSSAGKYLRGELGASAQGSSLVQPLLMEWWFSTSTAGRSMVSIASADRDYYLAFSLASATGFLTVTSKAPEVAATTTTVGAANLANGQLHHVIYDAAVQELYVDGVSIGAFGGILAVQDLSTLTIGANQVGGSLWAGSVSAVGVFFDGSMSASSLVDHYTCGTTGYAGETADERAARLTAYVGLAFSDVGTFSTGIAEQAALGRTCLEHLRDVEATESGKLYASRGAPMVTLQGRAVRYNPTSALSITYADFEPGDLELAYDTQKVANTLTLSRPGGATQRMVHAASKAARGPIGRSVDTLCTTDLVVTDLGNWLLWRYATPSAELRAARIEAFTMGQAIHRTLMAADISTVFTVTAMPAEAPATSMSVTVEGYREDIRHNQHMIQFLTSRTVTDTVWVLDDSTYSVLGSTTRLAY